MPAELLLALGGEEGVDDGVFPTGWVDVSEGLRREGFAGAAKGSGGEGERGVGVWELEEVRLGRRRRGRPESALERGGRKTARGEEREVVWASCRSERRG